MSTSLPSSPPRDLLASVALVAASILLFEIALTRVFGTVLRYHLTFLAISIALCGLGVGGFATHFLRSRVRISLASLGVAYGLATVAALLILLRGVLAFYPEVYWLSALVVLVPFTLGGAWLAEAFARFPAFSGRIYAWDLGGAALAALLAVPILNFLPAPAAVVAAAVLGAGGGVLQRSSSPRERWVIPGAGLILLLLLGTPNSKPVMKLLDVPALPPKPDEFRASLADRGITQPLFTEMGTPGHKSSIIETRHNAFARTDVVDDPEALGAGGFFLYTNGNVPTNMMFWDGHLNSLAGVTEDFRLPDWCFNAARLNRADTRVFSIGPGGGLDALLALKHHAGRFDGAEINPSILDIMEARAGMNGGVYQKANVRVQVADGRAMARQALARGVKYDLIYSALTKTATAGQGLALLESFIQTREAFTDYWKLLKPQGQAAIVLDNPYLVARFVATWLQVLEEQGISNREAMRHIAIAADPQPGPYVLSLVVQKTAFTREQSKSLFESANLRALDAVWIPDQAALRSYGPYPQLADGTLNLAGFIRGAREGKLSGQKIDISPCSDDRPFVLDLSLEPLPGMRPLTFFAAVLGVALAALGLLTARRSPPLIEPRTQDQDRPQVLEASTMPEGAEPKAEEEEAQAPLLEAQSRRMRFGVRDVLWIGYFLLLGVGFMLIEIPLSQLLILPLGYPTLALSVILFSILLGGGAGAWVSQKFGEKCLAWYALACALAVAGGALIVPVVVRSLASSLPLWSLNARVALAAVMLLPLGFVLGTPFPSGLRLFARRHPDSVPLVWGLNGVASVVGSLSAALSARAFGFSQTLIYGAAIYVVAAVLVLWLGHEASHEPSAEPSVV